MVMCCVGAMMVLVASNVITRVLWLVATYLSLAVCM